MKNIILSIFVCFLFVSISCTRKNLLTKALRVNSLYSLKSQRDCKLSIERDSWISSNRVCGNPGKAWICAKDKNNKMQFYKNAPITASVKGTQPSSCENLATNKPGELYVVSDKKLYFLAENGTDLSSYSWNEVENSKDIVDVSVNNLGNVFTIDSKGTISQVLGAKMGNIFTKTDLGDNSKIEAFSDEVIYALNSVGNVYKVSSKNKELISDTLNAYDLCVDFKSTLYLATSTGIFAKKISSNDFVKVSDDKVTSIGCAWLLWFVGVDGYIYKSPVI